MIVRPRLRATLTAIIALAMLSPTITAASAAVVPSSSRYVALGDSYTAGPLIPHQRTDPFGCFRSDHDYPALLAAALRVSSFADVSCSAAKTDDMANPQSLLFGHNPPQFNALTDDTTLVTIGIGGNDVGFGEIVQNCALLSVTQPFGAPCKEHYTAGGIDQLRVRIAAVAPKIANVLRGIHQRSPAATIAVVGYQRILPPTTGCWPYVPFAAGDVGYLDEFQQELNSMIAAQATDNEAMFVDTYAPSLGHDVCQAHDTRWVEGVIPGTWAFPLHPNAEGMVAVAGIVQRALR